jgi:hypothetical protein
MDLIPVLLTPNRYCVCGRLRHYATQICGLGCEMTFKPRRGIVDTTGHYGRDDTPTNLANWSACEIVYVCAAKPCFPISVRGGLCPHCQIGF